MGAYRSRGLWGVWRQAGRHGADKKLVGQLEVCSAVGTRETFPQQGGKGELNPDVVLGPSHVRMAQPYLHFHIQ